jgi:hypothetical protein
MNYEDQDLKLMLKWWAAVMVGSRYGEQLLWRESDIVSSGYGGKQIW